jgi:hypothetical protein
MIIARRKISTCSGKHSENARFEIKNGKIWIQQNWTEILVATELIERGCQKPRFLIINRLEGLKPSKRYSYRGICATNTEDPIF